MNTCKNTFTFTIGDRMVFAPIWRLNFPAIGASIGARRAALAQQARPTDKPCLHILPSIDSSGPPFLDGSHAMQICPRGCATAHRMSSPASLKLVKMGEQYMTWVDKETETVRMRKHRRRVLDAIV
eukprot:482800-Amphidinium_carterae.1